MGRDGPAPAPAAARGGQIVASIRGEPRTFNRYVAADQASEVLSLLLQARLVRINRATFELEPWLAEKWESSPDGRTHTHSPAARAHLVRRHAAHLRRRAVFAAGGLRPESGKRPGRQPHRGRPAAARRRARPADRRLYLRRPRRAAASACSTGCRSCRSTSSRPRSPPARSRRPTTRSTPPAEVVGAGPFVLREYQPGQRVVLDRNPRYWRKAARRRGAAVPRSHRPADRPRAERGAAAHPVGRNRPHVDRAAAGRLRAGATGGRRRPAAPDRARRRPRCRRALVLPEARGERQGPALRVRRSGRSSARRSRTPWIGKRLRKPCSSSAAVPVWGPITPGNTRWFWPDIPRYPHNDDTREDAAARASASRIATATAWWKTRKAPRRASP